jgi:hypothetical protein
LRDLKATTHRDEDGVSEGDDGFEGTALTDEQVTEVLYQMERCHDCNNGITWDVVEQHVEFVRGN